MRFGVLVAAALAAVAAAYAMAPQGAFLWDDRILIVENPTVRTVNVVDAFVHPFWRGADAGGAAYYRPLISLSYALEWRLHGANPAGYHVTNLLLHFATVMLVALLARRAGATPVAAAFAAAIWGVHPRLTESVAWISGRTDIGAALFTFAALLAWERGLARRASAALLLLAGLLCKEVAIAAVPALLAAEVVARRHERGRWRAAITTLWPLVPPLLAYATLRSFAMRGVAGPAGVDGLVNRVAVVLHAIGTYATMLLDPLRPSMQIGLAGLYEAPCVAAGAAAVTLCAVLAWRARARWTPGVASALCLSTAALALVVKVIPLDIMVVAADRFLYVPLAGLAVATAAACSRLTLPRAKVALVVAASAGVVLGVVTFRRTASFEDDLAFWVAEARRAPAGSVVPGVEIGNALSRDARYEDALGVYNRVLSDLRAANTFPPTIVRDVRRNLAVALARIGRIDDAIAIVDLVVAGAPNDITLLRSRTTLLLMARRWEDADQQLTAIDRIAPEDPTARAIRKLAGELRREWVGLDKRQASSGETAALLAARARLLARMDVQREAGELYEAVAARSDATPAELREASVWLVRRGRLPAASSALDRYGASGAADASELWELLGWRVDRQRQVDAALARLGG
jgi:hypothetical protein